MASILRQIVAGPRLRHPEAGLDLCYVTDYLIATSGPSSSYPQRAYRNPTEDLVKWLDDNHGEKWSIWEFRAEGTGYDDSEVHNRIQHFPWPDHHPPPFSLVPKIIAGMRDWVKGPDAVEGRMIVVHCKAGKGRSGSMATSYMISEEGWTVEDALERFTQRRMRVGFGPGISIPSQARYIRYVDWWTRHGKIYVERQVEVVEVHVWGLREGVKVDLQGYVDNGKTIKVFHTFTRDEKVSMGDDQVPTHQSIKSPSQPQAVNQIQSPVDKLKSASQSLSNSPRSSTDSRRLEKSDTESSIGGEAVLFRPSQPIILPTSDVNIDFERRNKARYGLTMVTSVAHVWFNTFFEAHYELNRQSAKDGTSDAQSPVSKVDPANPPTSGVFTLHWDAMDGIKGSSRKGTRAFDQFSIVWRAVMPSPTNRGDPPTVVTEPPPGQAPEQTGPSAKGDNSRILPESEKSKMKRNLGLRTQSPTRDISRSNSPVSAEPVSAKDDDSEKGIQSFIPDHRRPNDDPNKGSRAGSKAVVEGDKEDHLSSLSEKEQKIPGEIMVESKQS